MGSPFTIVNGWLTVRDTPSPRRIRLSAVTIYEPVMRLHVSSSPTGVYISLGRDSICVSFPEIADNLALLQALDEHFAK